MQSVLITHIGHCQNHCRAISAQREELLCTVQLCFENTSDEIKCFGRIAMTIPFCIHAEKEDTMCGHGFHDLQKLIGMALGYACPAKLCQRGRDIFAINAPLLKCIHPILEQLCCLFNSWNSIPSRLKNPRALHQMGLVKRGCMRSRYSRPPFISRPRFPEIP